VPGRRSRSGRALSRSQPSTRPSAEPVQGFLAGLIDAEAKPDWRPRESSSAPGAIPEVVSPAYAVLHAIVGRRLGARQPKISASAVAEHWRSLGDQEDRPQKRAMLAGMKVEMLQHRAMVTATAGEVRSRLRRHRSAKSPRACPAATCSHPAVWRHWVERDRRRRGAGTMGRASRGGPLRSDATRDAARAGIACGSLCGLVDPHSPTEPNTGAWYAAPA
jgi:hypothetical protein